MTDKLSKNKSVRTEQLVRDENLQAKDRLKKYLHDDEKSKSEPLGFDCECSDPKCDKHVRISIDEYESVHKRKDRFTISKGHETPEVEKIVSRGPKHDIVEKHELKP